MWGRERKAGKFCAQRTFVKRSLAAASLRPSEETVGEVGRGGEKEPFVREVRLVSSLAWRSFGVRTWKKGFDEARFEVGIAVEAGCGDSLTILRLSTKRGSGGPNKDKLGMKAWLGDKPAERLVVIIVATVGIFRERFCAGFRETEFGRIGGCAPVAIGDGEQLLQDLDGDADESRLAWTRSLK